MRVLHVLPPAAGGMLRHVRQVMGGLTDVESACAAVPGAGFETLDAAFPGRCAPLPFPETAGIAALLRAAILVRHASRRLRPDLLHGHGYRGMVVAGTASRFSGIPFAFTAHTLPEELGASFWRRVRPLARRARGAVCVSRAIATGLTDRLGLPGIGNSPLRVIYNGVDPGPPPGPRSPLPSDLRSLSPRGVVVTAARLAPQKGIGILLEAWALLPPGNVLLVAGDGPLQIGRASCRERV